MLVSLFCCGNLPTNSPSSSLSTSVSCCSRRCWTSPPFCLRLLFLLFCSYQYGLATGRLSHGATNQSDRSRRTIRIAMTRKKHSGCLLYQIFLASYLKGCHVLASPCLFPYTFSLCNNPCQVQENLDTVWSSLGLREHSQSLSLLAFSSYILLKWSLSGRKLWGGLPYIFSKSVSHLAFGVTCMHNMAKGRPFIQYSAVSVIMF